QNNGYTYDATHNLIAGYPAIEPPAPPAAGGVGGCVNNSSCTWSSVAGVRYVLNTLFNLQYTVVDTTYIRSSPVVIDGVVGGVATSLMYQGSFDYPSMGGHVKVFNSSTVTAGSEILDLATSVPSAASRNLKTSMDGATLIDFNAAQLASNSAFQTALGLSVTYAASPTTYNNTINRIRGVDTATGADKANRLGGVEHSAVAIVKPYSRSNPTRPTMAYFGTLDGVLEAFNVDSLHGGAGSITEVWGFVPKGQLASLQNIRNQPSSIQPYPGVDASPTVAELLYDHDSNPATNNWRTIMTTLTGKYGASPSVIAFDITDPTTPDLLWEKTRADAGLSLLGAGLRASMGVAKDAAGAPVPTVFAAVNKKVTVGAVPAEHGGIQAYAFNLFTGDLLWQFSADYSGSQNDLPGAITAIDKDQDGSEDVVLIGDMDGRLWKLDALTGANLMGAGVPLFDAGVNYPIAASPSITADKDGNLLAVFGTGGADWAPADAGHIHHIFAVNLETGAEVWNIPLNAGEKAYGSPTIAHGSVYVTTAYGTMESANPSDDLNSTAQKGNLRAINLETGALDATTEVGNMRGAVYVKGGKAYTSTLDGQVSEIDLGYESGGVNALKLLWKQQ
ncbi:MAG: PQQ-binding-like beta-propeller repeat protein, partial [Nitrospinae bacterium]|nr:PQQ-binding-like beta-propeller repeat protein [Nitrospinota bacterium]